VCLAKIALAVQKNWSILGKKRKITDDKAMLVAKEFKKHSLPRCGNTASTSQLSVDQIPFDESVASSADMNYLYARLNFPGNSEFHNALSVANENATKQYKGFTIFRRVLYNSSHAVPLCGLHLCSQIIQCGISSMYQQSPVCKLSST
jgi:hypothetical protein